MGRRLAAVALAWAASLLVDVAVAEPSTPPGFAEQLRAVHRDHPSHGARLAAVSRLLVGAPFARSPLGEGPGRHPDPDPTFDVRRFDCVTFVEQVMALSWHPDLTQASATLQRVRYTDGAVRYGARKHIMMAQWIPQNVAAGFVTDVTAAVGGKATAKALLTVRSRDFDGGLGKRLELPAPDRPVGTYSLPMIAAADLLRRVDRVAHGTVITTIRAARAGVPYRASHVGLVIVAAGERRIRHADRRAGAIVDEPLERFLSRSRRLRRPPVAGFHLLTVAPAAPP
jgi:hypothetical protein